MSARMLKLYTHRSQFSGTDFFEFLPGEFQGKHWNDRSVYVSEGSFQMFHSVFYHALPDFDWYDYTPIGRSEWQEILRDIEAKRQSVKAWKEETGPEWVHGKQDWTGELVQDFWTNQNRLVEVLEDLSGWATSTLITYKMITVLGL